MEAPGSDRSNAEGTRGDLAAAALAILDDAEVDPNLDELADAIEAGCLAADEKGPRVLLIDPDHWTRGALVAALVDGGCQVVAALRTGVTAIYAVRQHRPTVIVVDLDLADVRAASHRGPTASVPRVGRDSPDAQPGRG